MSCKAPIVLMVALGLLSISSPLYAQRPLCNQLPAAERDRARAAGFCRDPAPIIDVAPSAGVAMSVPNVVGMSFDDARNRLARFLVQRSYRAAAEPGGTVLAQTPMAPATLAAGTPVTLVLSDGSLVRVPRVAGININDARQRLQKEIDLKAQPVVVTSDLRVGTVIEQEPAEGTLVKRGSVVRLQVSAGQEGPELIDVPSVVGMPFDRAKSRLVRFVVERTQRPRADASGAPEWQVIEQSPRAPARAAAGSVIVLTVSGAPRAMVEVFEMPNVVGRAYADAARSLAEFKVARSEVESAEPSGRIVAQTPAAGSALSPGGAVSLQVSAGAASATAATTKASPAEPIKPAATHEGPSVFRSVSAISGAVLLGLIFGALLMRQWLIRQRAVAAVDSAITSMSPAASPLTTVDILLDEEPLEHPSAVEVQSTETESQHEQEKHPGP